MILHDVYNLPVNDVKSRLAALRKVILILDEEDDELIEELLDVLIEFENDDYFGTEGFEI